MKHAPPMPLYPTDEEIARALFGNDREKREEWKRTLKAKEILSGFPKPDPEIGRRYWPKVKAWFDRRAGLTGPAIEEPDGQENWDEDRRPRTRKTGSR